MEFKRHKLLDFPTMLLLNSGAKSKNNLRGYVAFKGNTINKCFFLIFLFLVIGDLYCFFI